MVPEYWLNFIASNQLVGKDFEIDEESDLSELGADLKIMSKEQSIDESTNCSPGIWVSKSGYIPVGMCLSGSGDYYYLNVNDGKAGPLYRIYHDDVDESGFDDKAIDKVLENYEQLLSHQSS
ncbi:MAG: hypothetical protein ABFS32_21490 [Bacteroidota bacterium]